MKVLFLILVLANLGVFAWMRFGGGEPTTSMAAAAGSASDSASRLQLRHELAPVPPAAPQAGTSVHGEPGACFSAGPMAETAALDLVQRLKSRGFEVVLGPPLPLQPIGYWVYLPPADTLAAAQTTGRRLAEKGITDHVFVIGAEKANAISLGLFPDRLAAEVRVAQLQALGFTAQFEQRYARVASVRLTLTEGQPPGIEAAAAWQPVDCQAQGQ